MRITIIGLMLLLPCFAGSNERPRSGKPGSVDDQGRIWIRDRAHAKLPDHWDVQIDDGADYIRIDRFQYQPSLINYRRIDPSAVRAVPLGEGILELDPFFAGLKDGGFDGYVAYEICSPIRGGGSEANLDSASRHALDKIRGWCR